MDHPQTWLEVTKCANEVQQIISTQNIKPSFIPHPRHTNLAPLATPLKI
jgi:hypothetical protein